MNKLVIWDKNGSETIMLCDEHLEKYVSKRIQLGYSRMSVSNEDDANNVCQVCDNDKQKQE